MANKPIQIAVSLTRAGEEQHGQQTTLVLCDDGRIFERRQSTMDPMDQPDGTWEEVKGPWNALCAATHLYGRGLEITCIHAPGHSGWHRDQKGIEWLPPDAPR